MYIDATSRASKLQVSKVWELRDLNPRLPSESLNIGKLTESFSIWTREVKSVAVCSVYDMLLGIPIGLLHKIAKGLTVFWITLFVQIR